MLENTILALVLGILLDYVFGTPKSLPKISTLIANGYKKLEGSLLKVRGPGIQTTALITGNESRDPKKEKIRGACMVIGMAVAGWALSALILWVLYGFHRFLGLAAESFLCFELLSVRSLTLESRKIGRALNDGHKEGASNLVTAFTGRNTHGNDPQKMIKSTIRKMAVSVIEDLVGPMFFILIGGIPLGIAYRAVTIADDTIGYRSIRYQNFGWFAAKADDVLDYLPSRIAACGVYLSAKINDMDEDACWNIFQKNRQNHAGPNDGQTEAAFAGALGLQLVEEEDLVETNHSACIGVDTHEADSMDLWRASDLSSGLGWLMLGAVIVVRILFLI